MEINKQEILIGTYVDQVDGMKDNLTAVPTGIDVNNNPAPISTQTDLDTFLTANDCTKNQDKDTCYIRNRLVMIKMARRIDYLDNYKYIATATIQQLQKNIIGIIDGLKNVKMDPTTNK